MNLGISSLLLVGRKGRVIEGSVEAALQLAQEGARGFDGLG
jgi:hypothetical protein